MRDSAEIHIERFSGRRSVSPIGPFIVPVNRAIEHVQSPAPNRTL